MALAAHGGTVNFLFFRYMSFESWVLSIHHLQTLFQFFKQKARSAFCIGRYHALGMPTQKLHALDYLCEAVTHVSGTEILRTEVYESSDKQLKAMYGNSCI